jgi:exodeoxyribonuclease VII small subunit
MFFFKPLPPAGFYFSIASLFTSLTLSLYLGFTTMARKTFEQAMAQLEQITSELESGDLSLDLSLKKFEEGIKLADFCNKKLEESKKKVSLLLEKNNSLIETPFENHES